MKISHMRSVLALIFSATLAGATMARAENRVRCEYPSKVSMCAPYGCLPEVPPETDPEAIPPGTPAFCGKCSDDRQCGGAKCDVPAGTCAVTLASPPPIPIWPRFHLLVADVSVNLADAGDPRPILAAGYVFQGAFGKTKPTKLDGGGYVTPDLPRWYWSVGGSIAAAGPAQNLFADGGITRYVPDGPLSVTTLSLGFLYQRQGASIWDPGDDVENSDRIGPCATVGILQNLFLRVSYVFPLRGPNDHGALILSATFMKDLASDLVPDRFQRFLPGQLR